MALLYAKLEQLCSLIWIIEVSEVIHFSELGLEAYIFLFGYEKCEHEWAIMA